MEEQKNILKFENLSYRITNTNRKFTGEHVQILECFSGQAKSGQITAVMGTSGCGKTHLLKLLVGDIEDDAYTKGKILFNGQTVDPVEWMDKIAYLPQESVYYPELTIYETLVYYLKFNKKDKTNSIHKIALEILKDCGILKKKSALCSSLSVGELKRAMISLALSKKPEIVFLDEPTSGLDSLSAMIIINNLKRFAENNNCIVFLTLHQPGTAIFNMIDHLIFMVPRGLFYSGSISDIPSFLKSYGIVQDDKLSLSEFLFLLNAGDIPKYSKNLSEVIRANEKRIDSSIRVDDYETTHAVSDEFKFGHVLNILITSTTLHIRRTSFFNLIVNYLVVLWLTTQYHFTINAFVTPAAFKDKDFSNFSLVDFFLSFKLLYISFGAIISTMIVLSNGIDFRQEDCFKLEIITGKYSYASYVGFLYLQKFLISLSHFILFLILNLSIVSKINGDSIYLALPSLYYLCIIVLQIFLYMLCYSFLPINKFLGVFAAVIIFSISAIPAECLILVREAIEKSELPNYIGRLTNFWIFSAIQNFNLFFSSIKSPAGDEKDYISLVYDFPMNKIGLILVGVLLVLAQAYSSYMILRLRIIPKVRTKKIY